MWDFNDSAGYFATDGAQRWREIEDVVYGLRPQLQASDQAGKVGNPIFDPKGTNARLTEAAADLGWFKVPVPPDLRSFGKDWDAGKGSVLAEWQFSNYPFLWNNVTRTEMVFQSEAVLHPLVSRTEALIIVTKSGSFPASNSTLYAEQAAAQLDRASNLGVFNIPIRLVGLMVPPDVSELEADWNRYGARYGRTGVSEPAVFDVQWGREAQHGNRSLRFIPR